MDLEREYLFGSIDLGTALIVDDESMMVRLCKSIMQEMDFQVLEAYNAEAALSVLANESDRITLMLTDIRMGPGMDGVELAKRVRNAHPHIHIIIMSGFAEEESVRRMLTGLDFRFLFLHKPFTVAALRDAVQVTKIA
jgi:YesN/AraC family two-component response regulator